MASTDTPMAQQEEVVLRVIPSTNLAVDSLNLLVEALEARVAASLEVAAPTALFFQPVVLSSVQWLTALGQYDDATITAKMVEVRGWEFTVKDENREGRMVEKSLSVDVMSPSCQPLPKV